MAQYALKLAACAACALILAPAFPTAAHAGAVLSVSDLDQLSIEELGKVEVSSVSKTAQPLGDAPAAIYVLTHQDVIRSGRTSLPEILRLAPNLQVARVAGANFAISARGFNGTAADKLLVLIDGRAVYTPFANGVFWDAQFVPPENIERIEVISGPGATLWGANAVNGVINIITRASSDTQGGSLEVGGGDRANEVTAQYGGRLRENLTYRAYFDRAAFGNDETASGANAQDSLRRWQTGFRLDWSAAADLVTVQGDAYHGVERQLANPSAVIAGQNLLARWTRPTSDAGSLRVQAYYDRLHRRTPGEYDEDLRTYDLEVQHSFALGTRHSIVWGAGYRITQDDFNITPNNPSSIYTQFFNPQKRTLKQGGVFAEDTIALHPALSLIVGLKLEAAPYSSVEPLPSVRLSWKPTDADLVWASVARAIRAPSRLDRDFNQTLRAQPILTGGRFVPEKLVAYQLGYRTQASPRLSASISAYYNVYRDLRSFEYSPVTMLPLIIENQLGGRTYGVEAWAGYQLADWWRLSLGANWLHKDLRFRPGSSGTGGVQIAGNDPPYQVSLRSTMSLGDRVTFDLDARDIGALPAPASPAYFELGARLAWRPTGAWELSLTGSNLVHAHHFEFGSGNASVQLGASGVATARSVYLATRVSF